MSVLILACVGGLLAILSPCCILPVLPFVFARLGQPFRSSVLPMLVGMAVSFAAVGSLADPLSQPLARLGTGSERPIPLRSSFSILGCSPKPLPLIEFSSTFSDI